jgi:mono/diheme cytochrome c family protein
MSAGPGLSPRATHALVGALITGLLVTFGASTCMLMTHDSLGSGGDPATASDGTRGEQLYGLCVTCHERDGRGKPRRAPPLVGSPYVNGPDDPLIRIALDGLQGTPAPDGGAYVERMTGFERLSDADLAAVLTYIRERFGRGAGPISADAVRRVRGLTSGRLLPWTPRELQVSGQS